MNNESFDYRDYRKFSNLKEYVEATRKIDVHLPRQLFIAISKVMEKRHMTFGEACELLEGKGYLIWVGKLAIYDLKGDLLYSDIPTSK